MSQTLPPQIRSLLHPNNNSLVKKLMMQGYTCNLAQTLVCHMMMFMCGYIMSKDVDT